jgi:predicted RNA-binding Zn-ribbon protein involved in translation (DUF1610 family)
MSLGQSHRATVIYEELAVTARRATPEPAQYQCDMCGQSFAGPPAGSGLLMWTRGTEVRYEEPPLCETCGGRVAVGALMQWLADEEE